MSVNKDKCFNSIHWEALENTALILISVFNVILLQSLYSKSKIITLTVKDYNASWLYDLLKKKKKKQTSGIEKSQLLSYSFFVQCSLR